MKKSILLFTLIFTGLFSFAQDTYNLVLFSDDGEPFFAFVNGIRQNDKPETNIKVTGLNSQALSIRVQFEDGKLPVLKQNMAPEAGYEHTVRIKKNVKKVMKMQYFGKVALNEAPRTTASTIQYHTAENPMDNGSQQTDNGISNDSESTTMNTASTTVNTSSPNSTAVNMNAGGVGITMNVTTEGTVYQSTSVNSSTYTTTNTAAHHPKSNNVSVSSSTVITTTSSATHQPRSGHVSGGIQPTSTLSPAASSITPRPMNPALNSTTTIPATTSGCGVPMNDEAYEKLKTAVDEKPFEDNKMSIAKAGTNSNCLSVAQIKGICDLFTMDDHKLTYAKYAYAHCLDKQNYFQVNDVFTFPRYTEDLNKFLQQQK
ncbi:MAG: DUF4476 domain-containing protein [Bacteroidia bacterium]